MLYLSQEVMSNHASTSRLAGRAHSEMRPLHLSIGHLDRVDGSAKFGFGSTLALASFSGPMEVRLREELIDRATLEIVHRPLEGVAATSSRSLISSMQTILPPLLNLQKHPRSLLQLIIQSLTPSLSTPSTNRYYIDETPSENQHTWPKPPATLPSEISTTSGGLTYSSKAASINASSLAILDAGSIEMTGIPVAISLCSLDNTLIIDPTAEEEEKAESRYGFGWVFGMGYGDVKEGEDVKMEMDGEGDDGVGSELVWVGCEGDFTRQQFNQARIQSRVAAKEILDFMKTKLEEYLTSVKVER